MQTLGDEESAANVGKPFKPLPPPNIKEVFSRQTTINLIAYTALALHSITFDQLLPVFMYQSLRSPQQEADMRLPFKFAGGFGLQSESIGFLFMLYGLFGMLVQFLVFPPIAHRYGILKCFKVCAILFPIVYAITPFTSLVDGQRNKQIFAFILMMVKSVCIMFAFPCSTILLTNSAVSLRILGTVNGFATSFAALGRGTGPAIGGNAFSFGVKHGYVGFAWWVLAFLAAVGIPPVWMLTEMHSCGSDSDSDEREEEQQL